MTPTHAQARPAVPAATHLTIPYLTNPESDEIEFAAAECDVLASGRQMACRFRQVFITRASFDASACVITSNGYDQRFTLNTRGLWIAATEPQGACGVVETTTLEDGGGTRWTMTVAARPTRADGGDSCRSETGVVTRYTWRDVKRPISCSTIQPGSIER